MPANTEKGNIVAIGEDKELLRQWMKDQLAPEPYKDGNWSKVFNKGGPLEWNNPPFDMDNCDSKKDHYGQGIGSVWTTIETVRDYIQNAKKSFGFTTVPEVIGFKQYQETLLLN